MLMSDGCVRVADIFSLSQFLELCFVITFGFYYVCFFFCS